MGAGIAAAIVTIVAIIWASSLLPSSYSMAEMGRPDYGGGPEPVGGGRGSAAHGSHGHGHGQVSSGIDIATLTGPDPRRPADVTYTLTARQGRTRLPDGRKIDGFTLNGQTPGPVIEAVQGQLVEVVLRNDNVSGGVSLHWHGVDVPNAMDGVAGLTQDAVSPGGSYTYRFVAGQVGTYWYHSHQDSVRQVSGGLLGALVIRAADDPSRGRDVTALVHFYGGVRTVNGIAQGISADAQPGSEVRVRIINTDDGPMPVWVPDASYRVLAVDGTDVTGATPVVGLAVMVTAGGRVDLGVTVPASGGASVAMAGAAIRLGGRPGARATGAATSAPHELVDLLSYGSPSGPAIDPATANRVFDYAIGRRFGLLNGRPGLWWTINGRQFPNVPMFVVAQGDLVVIRISNSSGLVHPMHLHGHHVVVLSRNGVAATGSPWVVDTLNVQDGDSYEIALRADNPGIWMDHCHTLPHAAQGLVTHLAYTGYTTPFRAGGAAHNNPEG